MSPLHTKAELMAPAGSFEALRAALQGGADSIYFGVEQLNMRARSARTFVLEDLPKIRRITAEKNVRAYLTLNTVIFDHDIALMKRIVDAAVQVKLDAIIAADQAVLNYCRKSDMPVHISTQTNVSNIDSIEFYSPYANAVVLARELNMTQVAGIVQQVKRREITGQSGELMKIEVFAHGALCMAVSGKCYLSLHSHNASANRGACVQNCRRQYTVIDKEDGIELEIDNEYIMSAKDLCTINFLDKLLETGVNILKIEGRGRSADYVFTTTRCYREAIDAFYAGTYTKEKVEHWMKELSRVFNRGFWEGYYLGKKMGEWTDEAGSKATEKKIYLAKTVRYYSNKKAGEFVLETGKLAVDDAILITGNVTGVMELKVAELRVNNQPVRQVEKGETFTLLLPDRVRAADKLYKIVPA